MIKEKLGLLPRINETPFGAIPEGDSWSLWRWVLIISNSNEAKAFDRMYSIVDTPEVLD